MVAATRLAGHQLWILELLNRLIQVLVFYHLFLNVDIVLVQVVSIIFGTGTKRHMPCVCHWIKLLLLLLEVSITPLATHS